MSFVLEDDYDDLLRASLFNDLLGRYVDVYRETHVEARLWLIPIEYQLQTCDGKAKTTLVPCTCSSMAKLTLSLTLY